MNRFDQHREYPAACLYAVGLSAYVSRTLLLSLSTVADAKISNPPWVNFQPAGWVSFQSAPTPERSSAMYDMIFLHVEVSHTHTHVTVFPHFIRVNVLQAEMSHIVLLGEKTARK